MQQLQMNTIFGTIKQVRERHVLADNEKGVIIANVIMDHKLGDMEIMSTPIAEFFILDGSKIQTIEAIFSIDTFGASSGWERKSNDSNNSL